MRTGYPALLVVLIALLTGCATAPDRAPGLAQSSPPSAQPPARGHDPSQLRKILAQADVHFAGDRLADAEVAFAQALADPAFASLPAEERRAALSAAARVAVRIDEHERARDRFRQAIQASPADAGDHFYLSQLEFDLDNKQASARLMVEVIQRWPVLVHEYSSTHIFRLLYPGTLSADDRMTLLEALFASDWDQGAPGADSAWFDLVPLRAQRGDRDGAREVAARIRHPSLLASMRVDRQFDGLFDPAGPAGDLANAAAQYVVWTESLADRDPPTPGLELSLSYARLTAGQHQETIAGVDAALRRLDGARGEDLPGLKQADAPWLLNNRAIALRRLGRFDEAYADLDRASRMAERGSKNVSQKLNKAQFLVALGQPRHALAELDDLGNTSVYGRMVGAEVQVRAGLALGDQALVDQGLDFLREHRQERPTSLVETLVRAGEIDEAAAVLVELLGDPVERPSALTLLQEHRTGPALPDHRQWLHNRQALLARRDVKEAVQRVGRIESLPFYGDPTMD